jgi:hypothetical protein
MNRWRVGEDMGSKEMDRCPLTAIFKVPSAAFETHTSFGIHYATFGTIFSRLFHGAVHILLGLCCKGMESVSIFIRCSLQHQGLHDFIACPSLSFELGCLRVFLMTVSCSVFQICGYSPVHSLARQAGCQC